MPDRRHDAESIQVGDEVLVIGGCAGDDGFRPTFVKSILCHSFRENRWLLPSEHPFPDKNLPGSVRIALVKLTDGKIHNCSRR